MKKLLVLSSFLVILIGFFTACRSSQSEEVYRETRFLFDTEVFIEAYGTRAEDAIRKAIEVMDEINLDANFYSEDSEITKLNNAAGLHTVTLSSHTFELLQSSLQIAHLTNGAFDPTIGPLVRLWQKAKEENILPTVEEIKEIIHLVDYNELILDSENLTAFLPKQGMSIDLGAIAKGYAVEKGMEVLRAEGITSALVRAGGNVYTIGTKPDDSLWKVGFRDPHQLENTIGFIEAENIAVDTAGNYEQSIVVNGQSIGHIINPQTGYPVEYIASCAIISTNPTLADALSTAVITLGAENGLELIETIPDTEGIIVRNDGSNVMSKEFGSWFIFKETSYGRK